ncbi:MAG: hypothetical protein JO205_04000 [Pseudolabrys sp.]|nr:hypothetical protein [Pseudolabrys sp.]
MSFRAMVMGALLLVCGASSASATMLISEDRGGQIGHYLQAFATLRASGERVVIDGNCLSACTLVLGLVPRERICATPRARLGFHAAWMPDEAGRPVTSPMGTQALWNIYPSHVRSWITRHGGLSRRMIFMEGRQLSGVVQSCSDTREATGSVRRSERTARPQLIRYDSANASGRRY